MPNDRTTLDGIVRHLEYLGSLDIPPEEAARMMFNGVINPQLAVEFSERRTDKLLRMFARRRKKMEFADVKDMMVGMWIEGMVVGYKYAEDKLGG